MSGGAQPGEASLAVVAGQALCGVWTSFVPMDLKTLFGQHCDESHDEAAGRAAAASSSAASAASAAAATAESSGHAEAHAETGAHALEQTCRTPTPALGAPEGV